MCVGRGPLTKLGVPRRPIWGRVLAHILTYLARSAECSQGGAMLHWAVVFFIIAIIAAVLGFSGIAASAASIAKILFIIFLVIAIITFFVGRGRVPPA